MPLVPSSHSNWIPPPLRLSLSHAYGALSYISSTARVNTLGVESRARDSGTITVVFFGYPRQVHHYGKCADFVAGVLKQAVELLIPKCARLGVVLDQRS